MAIYGIGLLSVGVSVTLFLWRIGEEREAYHYVLSLLIIVGTIVMMACMTFAWIIYLGHTETASH